MKNKLVVCLGGGIGTVNLVKGLKNYTTNVASVISMADDGGSSGRLRRMYKVLPPGDLVSCMAAMVEDKSSLIPQLLTYRFPGDRYGKDENLAGHKLGNLIMVGLMNSTNNLQEAINKFQAIFGVTGKFYPATAGEVSISAITADGKEIVGEEKIDLGKYNGRRILQKVMLHPKEIEAASGVVENIKNADVIIAGPGDLYTTILPVLIVPQIQKALKESKAPKIFVINVANKPFETKGYNISDYIDAIKRHLGVFPFDRIIVNTNFSVKIPKKFHYQYVGLTKASDLNKEIKYVERDLIDEDFPLYHSSKKLAKAIFENI